jgi:DNA modification methylase
MSTAIRDRIIDFRRVRASDLLPHPRNWRRHPDGQRSAVRAALAEIGYADALLARRTEDGQLQLIDGHLRRELTPDHEVPVLVLDLTEEEAMKLLVVLDPLAGLAETDLPALESLLAELNFDLPELRDVALGVLQREPAPSVDVVEDEPPPVPEVADTQPGDLYLLGAHRLLCGDSTNVEDVRRLMDGHRAVLMATDPPYLVDYDGQNHPQSSVNRPATANKRWDDYKDPETSVKFFSDFIRLALAEALAPRAPIYQWHADIRRPLVVAAWELNGLLTHQTIIWAKVRGILTHSHFMWQHEPCLYGWVKGDMPEAGRRPPPNIGTVWAIDQTGRNGGHPTEKPVEIFRRPVEWHARGGEVVYEPFSGSGSQLSAAEQLGRRCFGMEQAPVYCDVIVARWEKLTGKTAERHRA